MALTTERVGLLAMIAACVIWGLTPLYYDLLSDVPPIEVLAHRTIWSLVFFGAVLAARARLSELARALGGPMVRRLALTAGLISINWFVFILSIQLGRTTEASLGYYIFPLVAVVLGVLVYRERLRVLQWLAVALAAAAVVWLSVGLGAPPWLALTLASSFGLYAVLKKSIPLPGLVTVTAEVVLLAPIAAVYLGFLAIRGEGVFLDDAGQAGLLMLSGPLTGLPLILFSFASQRTALSTLGLVQYLNPTLQFLCAVVIFGEPFGEVRALAFALIWTALALYSLAAIRRDRSRNRMSRAAVTEGTV